MYYNSLSNSKDKACWTTLKVLGEISRTNYIVASLNAKRFDDNSLSSQSRLLLVRRDNFSSSWDFVCVARVFLNQH